MKRSFLAAGLLILALGTSARGQEPVIPVQLVASQHTTLSAELPLKIERIAVKEGDRFKAGQPLVVFDCALHRAQLDEAQAVLGAAQKANTVHRRLLELNSTGALEADKAASDAAVAQAKLNSARAVVSRCAVPAPFNGRVVEQKARAHQYVQAGQPILDILDDSVLEAEFIVPSAWVGGLKPGVGLQVLVDETRKAYEARVVRVGAKVDPVSHSVKVVAEITGEHGDLMAGMTGRVKMAGP